MAIEYNDLRDYIEVLEKARCLKKVEHADWNVEIGTICEINSEQKGTALLFDKIKDYPEGYRLLTNFLFQPKQVHFEKADFFDVAHRVLRQIQLAVFFLQRHNVP